MQSDKRCAPITSRANALEWIFQRRRPQNRLTSQPALSGDLECSVSFKPAAIALDCQHLFAHTVIYIYI